MATYKSIERSKEYTSLSCDGCGSTNVQETIQGYVCGDCGLVLETQRLEYYRPYNEDVVQYAKLSTTQIGTKKERLYSPHARKLKNLYRLHHKKNNRDTVFTKAQIEIKRILGALDIPTSFQESIFRNFKKFYANFPPNTKYRSVEKLVSVVLYYILRDQNVSVNLHQLLEVSKISKVEFNHFRMQVGIFIHNRDCIQRQLYITQKLMELKSHFNFGMEFVFYAKKVMDRLWKLIKNTTDNVIAGVSASITVLCYYKDQVSINAICNLLGIRMSTIQFQVAHRIFENLRVDGFTTLKKSTSILKRILEHLGLLELEQEENAVNSLIKVELGKAVPVYNRKFDNNFYFFGLLTKNKEKFILGIKVYHSPHQIDGSCSAEEYANKLFDLELCKYSHGKGPPNEHSL